MCMRYRNRNCSFKKQVFSFQRISFCVFFFFGLHEISLFGNTENSGEKSLIIDYAKKGWDYVWGNTSSEGNSLLEGNSLPDGKSSSSDNSSSLRLHSPCEKAVICKNNLTLPFDVLPIVDWINNTNIKSFFQSSIKRILYDEEYFGEIDSFDQFTLWIEPYGLHSKYNCGETQFTFNTIGVSSGGGYNIDRLVIGGGIGGVHSKLNGKKMHEDSSINSFYFGPYLGYVFERGYFALMVLGKWNHYDVQKCIKLNSRTKKTPAEITGWNIDTRIEGGIDIKIFQHYMNDFFIQPNITIDYLNIFQNTIEEEERYSSFLRSLFALQFRKEYYKRENGLIIPNFSIGWIRMQPLVTDGFSFKFKESDQLYLNISLVGIHKRGILASINFEANIGSPYTTYIGNFRLEFDW